MRYDDPNCPVDAKALNPLPENAKTADTGNAGRDGYTVLSRANRYDGERSIHGTVEQFGAINLKDY